MSVFVDTSAILAVLSANDHNHSAAKETWQVLLLEDNRLTCHNYIVLETLALLQNRFGLEAVRLFENDILPVLEILWVDEQIHNQAISALLAANRRQLSLVDCTSFETMRLRGMSQVFTFDHHFKEYGFEVQPAP